MNASLSLIRREASSCSPGGQAHFRWTKSGEYVTQVAAVGLLGLAYVGPRDKARQP
jgi:hypothetical protein